LVAERVPHAGQIEREIGVRSQFDNEAGARVLERAPFPRAELLAPACETAFAIFVFRVILILLWFSSFARIMMNASESALSREEMERRRLSAAQHLLNGYSQSRVARMYGVSRTTASRWHNALVKKGVDSLKKRRATGRPSRLTAEQLQQLVDIFTAGPPASGLHAARWTTGRLALVIEARFGVRYDEDHVGRLMHRLGLRARRERADSFYAPSVYSPNTSLSVPEISPTVA
jgi:putative transposase